MFLFGRKKTPKPAKAVPVGSDQKRSAFRMPVSFDVLYALEGRRGRRRASANDLSAGGLRLATDEDFMPGSVLTLDFRLPDEFLASMVVEKEVYEQTPFGLRPETIKVAPPGFEPVHVEAKVLMPFFDRDARAFAYGVHFLDLDAKVEEELQRFMHLWQINYLRERKGEG
jgi:c-di-GMP-binding flagellar brake protein YcgR